MPEICIPCASVQKLFESGQFGRHGFTVQCKDGPVVGAIFSLHNQSLSFACAPS